MGRGVRRRRSAPAASFRATRCSRPFFRTSRTSSRSRPSRPGRASSSGATSRSAAPSGGEARELGVTPLKDVAIARGDYVLRLEREGFEPFERTISSALARSDPRFRSAAIAVAWTLRQGGDGASGNDRSCREGPTSSSGTDSPPRRALPLRDFLIDRYEVSNRDFAEFVAGGRLPPSASSGRSRFRTGAASLGWEEAPSPPRRPHRPARPARLDGGTFPDGTGRPSRRRASRGTRRTPTRASAARALPTIFQWEKAARDGVFTITGDVGDAVGPAARRGPARELRRQGDGPRPSGRVRDGPLRRLSHGRERLRVDAQRRARRIRDRRRRLHRSAVPLRRLRDLPRVRELRAHRIPLRARGAPARRGEEGDAPISRAEQAPTYPRSSRAQFEAWLAHYRYDRTPPDGRVEERVETPDWTRERVSFAGGGGARIKAWLYLPKSARPPYQVIQFVPRFERLFRASPSARSSRATGSRRS